MYDLRKSYPKTHPLNLIAKLLMNSLYGRFGMLAEKIVTEIFKIQNNTESLIFKRFYEAHAEHIKDNLKKEYI